MNKLGLVLEGGAMRGLFSAGVMDVMMGHGIRFDGIIGVSAGAAFGCNYKSGQIGRVLRYNKRFCREKRFCSWYSLLTTGDLFGAEFCYHELPEKLDIFDCDAFEKDPAEFYLVCTDVHTGKAHYQRCDRVDADCFEWMRASASMPLVSRIVKVGGGEYLDGAIADSIPLRFFESAGFSRNVVILTQCAGFSKHPSRALPLLKLALRKYPKLIETLAKRHENYNETIRYIEQQEKQGSVFLLRPESPLPCGRICHDPDLLQQTYDLGRAAAVKKLSALTEFVSAAQPQ